MRQLVTLTILAHGFAAFAHAGLITSTAPLASPLVIDFNQFTTRVNGVGPVSVGGAVGLSVIFTSTSSSSFVGATTGYSLGANGSWTPAKGPITASNATPGTITYTFAAPVNGVGGFINYTPTIGATIIALSSLGVPLESYDLEVSAPISTPGGVNAGAFRGILRSTNDIFALQLVGDVVLDDLTIAPVPEPSSVALLGLGVAYIALLKRRTQAAGLK